MSRSGPKGEHGEGAIETFAIECNDPSELGGLAGDPDLALFEEVSLRLRWWQPPAPLAALLREGPWRRLRSFALAVPARLPPEAFASLCAPEAPGLLELELDLAVDDEALGALVRDPRLAKLERLRLQRADVGAPGLRALIESGLPGRLDEFLAFGRSLSTDDARALIDAGFRPGASVLLDLHGPPEERLALKKRAEGAGLAIFLFEHDEPQSLRVWPPFEWLEPATSLSVDLDDAWLRRRFVEMPYEHPAATLTLRMRDPGALADIDWGHHYPQLEELDVASSDGEPLSVNDLTALTRWRWPATLRRLELHPHRWGGYQQYKAARWAAETIVRQLDRPPGASVGFSDLPDWLNPGPYESAVAEFQRPHCRALFRRR